MYIVPLTPTMHPGTLANPNPERAKAAEDAVGFHLLLNQHPPTLDS